MSIKKQYLKNGKCKVTFTWPGTNSDEKVAVLGEFNDWDGDSNPLKKLKNGSFSTTITLDKDNSYQFRYLIDGWRWENDGEADDQVPNIHGAENSVLNL